MTKNKTPKKAVAIASGALILTGCVSNSALDKDGAFRELPEPVRELAAPYQNLDKVRLDANDNCFWYLHNGPVEDTWLPLRTPKGNPICQAAS